MPNLNQVEIMGHLVQDAEMRYTKSGKAVTNMRVAVNRNYGDGTAFIDVEIWNKGNYKLAEYRGKDKKGSLVFIKGELKQDNWEDNNGNKRNKIKIVADKAFNFSEKKTESKQTEIDDELDDEFQVPF